MAISAISIQKIYYSTTPLAAVADDYDGVDPATGVSNLELKNWLATATEVGNVHGNTWNYDRTTPSVTWYKNELTGKDYRKSVTDYGSSVMSFSIGQYDLATKAAFEGGVADANRGSSPLAYGLVYMSVCALTADGVYIFFPKADIVARGTTTDDAIALNVQATAIEADIKAQTELWVMKTAVDAAA